MPTPAEDKRKAARIPVDFEVSFTFESREHKARALNLSADGMFVQTTYLLLQNDIVEIFFRLPDVSEPLWMKARVAWYSRVEGEASRAAGIGVQFLDPLPSQKEALENYLRQLLKN